MDKIDHIIYEWDIERGQISFSAKWVENFGETSQYQPSMLKKPEPKPVSSWRDRQRATRA